MVFTFSVVLAASSFTGNTPVALAAAAVARKLRRLGDNNMEDMVILLARKGELGVRMTSINNYRLRRRMQSACPSMMKVGTSMRDTSRRKSVIQVGTQSKGQMVLPGAGFRSCNVAGPH
jgi:hypothetical protein